MVVGFDFFFLFISLNIYLEFGPYGKTWEVIWLLQLSLTIMVYGIRLARDFPLPNVIFVVDSSMVSKFTQTRKTSSPSLQCIFYETSRHLRLSGVAHFG